VNYFTKVALVLRQIPPHSHFTDSDVRWETKDVTFAMDIPATKEELKSSLARMTLVPGNIVERSQLEREMALHFGDQVDVFAGDDAISVITKGIAQQNAYIGDRVKVKNLANNKIVDAVVLAPGVVNVTY
jgi:flagella basal body P-ring formation protein FlgA